MTEWLVAMMDSLGAPGAGLAIALENLFPPLPSEVILPLAGFTASRGEIHLLQALAWTTTGSVVGALALYWVGALLGRRRTPASACAWPSGARAGTRHAVEGPQVVGAVASCPEEAIASSGHNGMRRCAPHGY